MVPPTMKTRMPHADCRKSRRRAKTGCAADIPGSRVVGGFLASFFSTCCWTTHGKCYSPLSGRPLAVRWEHVQLLARSKMKVEERDARPEKGS